MKLLQLVLFAAAVAAIAAKGVAAAPQEAPTFALARFADKEVVRLQDFAGQVVVLDFFAYWCGPCQRSTPDIEEKIQKHYESLQSRPGDIKVSVISINVEDNGRSQTAAFIKRHRPSLVLDDVNGRTLEAYGGDGLPYIVVIDGTKATAASPRFEIVHRRAGYEGAPGLRKIIDGIIENARKNPRPD